MNQEIPEEFRTMAALLGESASIDSLMINKPTTLATDTSTIKRGIHEYQEQQKRERMQPTVHAPIEPIPNYVAPQPLPVFQEFPVPMPTYPPTPQKVDDGQLELNLEPTKAEEIIILLKEISTKLTKQNNMLEKIYANKPKEKTISNTSIKSRADS